MVDLGPKRIACDAVDISATGIAFLTSVPVERGEYLRVNFTLGERSDRTGRLRWYDADGVVARVARVGDHWIWGVEFAVIEERVVSEIQSYVAASLADRPGPVDARSALPGLPGGPMVAPVTGEYGPPDEREGNEARRAVGAEPPWRHTDPRRSGGRAAAVRPTVDDLRAVASRPNTPRVGISGRPLPDRAPTREPDDDAS